MPAQGAGFRQTVSLDPAVIPAVPNLAQAPPALIGPITDLLTFYADQWLVVRNGSLANPGDRFTQTDTPVASWADGRVITFGEDVINFDVELVGLDSPKTATVVVHHVPPQQLRLKMPASWMTEPVADSPNNWGQVMNTNGRYVAAAGRETFDVQLTIDLSDGKILAGTLENVVMATQRECTDVGLSACAAPQPQRIVRHVELTLEH
jgi:hypothetical protein